MQDRVLASVIFVPVVIIVLLVSTMILLGYVEEEPSNPVSRIPKVIMDHVGNDTLITVKAVGDHRYDEIHINFTSGNDTHSVSAIHRYVLDASIPGAVFMLNITVHSGEDHYFFNASVQVEILSNQPVYLWIKEEDDDEHTRHRSPYKTLAEWRDIK
jgi:hypothetical protein